MHKQAIIIVGAGVLTGMVGTAIGAGIASAAGASPLVAAIAALACNLVLQVVVVSALLPKGA